MYKDLDIQHQPILKKAEDDNKLALHGYILFPFLDEIAIQKLKDFYFQFQKDEPTIFYASTHSPNFEFRRKSSDFILELIETIASKHFKNYKLLGGAFVVKPGHGKGILQPHQDWNLVDETKNRSYNLWIPLVDVDVNNGAIFVLPQSHNKIATFRGPGIDSVFKGIEQEIWSDLIPLAMNAGEALLYDHALLHGSPPNNTGKSRIGIVVGIVNECQDLILFAKVKNQIKTFYCDENFFLNCNHYEPEKVLEEKKADLVTNPNLDVNTYKNLFSITNKNSSPKSYNFFKKLISLFR